MATREEYNACMRPYISGSKPKEERKEAFCVGAKICSGKAKTEAEARELCRNAPPKAPRPAKRGSRKSQKEQEACDLAIFKKASGQFKNLYLRVQSRNCEPCAELDALIKEAEIPVTIVDVPIICDAIVDYLGVDVFPTVIKMEKGKIVARHAGNPEETIEKMKRGE